LLCGWRLLLLLLLLLLQWLPACATAAAQTRAWRWRHAGACAAVCRLSSRVRERLAVPARRRQLLLPPPLAAAAAAAAAAGSTQLLRLVRVDGAYVPVCAAETVCEGLVRPRLRGARCTVCLQTMQPAPRPMHMHMHMHRHRQARVHSLERATE
jgi:hypothetical protein